MNIPASMGLEVKARNPNGHAMLQLPCPDGAKKIQYTHLVHLKNVNSPLTSSSVASYVIHALLINLAQVYVHIRF